MLDRILKIQYGNLLQPLELRHRNLENRIVIAAHGTNLFEMGLPGERQRAYCEAFTGARLKREICAQ